MNRAESGGPALLLCTVPASRREHASVAAWYKDDAVLVPSTDDLSKQHCFTGTLPFPESPGYPADDKSFLFGRFYFEVT